jgi:3-methyladenine DNA glycosylase AlkD
MTTAEVLSWLEKNGTRRYREGLARYGIVAPKAFGVPVGAMLKFAKRHGKDHALAGELWKSGWFEARMLAAMIDDPARVTRPQMEAWARDFDNWGICDTICFHLFDRTPHAWTKVARWHDKRAEFVKRAAFALLASLALHDKRAPDRRFVEGLAFIERAATDERNFVKKGVSWALRLIGRRNQALNAEAVAVARRLAASPEPAARWVGKGAVKELTSPLVQRVIANR